MATDLYLDSCGMCARYCPELLENTPDCASCERVDYWYGPGTACGVYSSLAFCGCSCPGHWRQSLYSLSGPQYLQSLQFWLDGSACAYSGHSHNSRCSVEWFHPDCDACAGRWWLHRFSGLSLGSCTELCGGLRADGFHRAADCAQWPDLRLRTNVRRRLPTIHA